MRRRSFEEAIDIILQEDPRYPQEAYIFIREALEYAARELEKPKTGKERHLSAKELLDSSRSYAIEQYGPMALNVLHHWGIYSTKDFGEIVFNLVEKCALGKSDEDKKEDFDEGFDFGTAFSEPFLPPSKKTEQSVTTSH